MSSFEKIDHVKLFILMVYPVGTVLHVTEKALTKISNSLSSAVVACPAEGERPLMAMRALACSIYDLASTTVSGIPMKVTLSSQLIQLL